MARDGWKKLVEERASLEAGETVTCAFIGKASGVVRDVAEAPAYAGAVTSLDGVLPPATRDKLTLALRFPLRSDLVVALTSSRFLVLKQRLGLRKPNLDPVFALAASDVVGASSEGGVALRKVALVLGDRSGVMLTFPRGQGDPAELVAAVAAQR